MRGTREIRCRARSRRSRICRFTSSRGWPSCGQRVRAKRGRTRVRRASNNHRKASICWIVRLRGRWWLRVRRRYSVARPVVSFALVALTSNNIGDSQTNMKKKKRHYVMTARSAKAEATRERICESVVHLYRERPIDEFTLDEVAQRAGTTVQTVLRAFKSKDNLIIEAL